METKALPCFSYRKQCGLSLRTASVLWQLSLIGLLHKPSCSSEAKEYNVVQNVAFPCEDCEQRLLTEKDLSVVYRKSKFWIMFFSCLTEIKTSHSGQASAKSYQNTTERPTVRKHPAGIYEIRPFSFVITKMKELSHPQQAQVVEGWYYRRILP